LAAFLVLPRGRSSLAWCSLLALAAIVVLWKIGNWSRGRRPAAASRPAQTVAARPVAAIGSRRIRWSIAILAALIFSKYFYLASLTSYYTFYLITRFDVGVRTAQVDLFVFLAAVAAGTILGGPVGDRIGPKYVIWGSILGVLPFTLMLPYATMFWTPILTVAIGLILASAFSAILVYAQELLPGRVGMISGIFFGFAFGMAGLGAALLGELADRTSIDTVYHICAFLPALGILTAFLPSAGPSRRTPASS